LVGHERIHRRAETTAIVDVFDSEPFKRLKTETDAMKQRAIQRSIQLAIHRDWLETLERRDLLAVTPIAADWMSNLPVVPAYANTFVNDTATDSNGDLFVVGQFEGTEDGNQTPCFSGRRA
jgi:hypothetical protein